MKLAPPDDDGERKAPGRIESMQLTRDVKMHLEMNGAALIPSGSRKPSGAAGQKEPPLEVVSQGPFHFDLQSYVATFTNKVDVVRLAGRVELHRDADHAKRDRAAPDGARGSAGFGFSCRHT